MLSTLQHLVALAERSPRPHGPAVASISHVCYGNKCAMVSHEDVYVCLSSWNVHFCGSRHCDRCVADQFDGEYCEVSGTLFNHNTKLVADAYVAFSGSQRVERIDNNHNVIVPEIECPDATVRELELAIVSHMNADAASVGLVDLEEHKTAPFDAQRQKEQAARERLHNKRMTLCRTLLEMLLFSRTRQELNQWGQQHATVKTNSSVAKYMAKEPIQYVEHVNRIMNSEARETEWCRSMPQRGSPAEAEGLKACEAACMWWNRFEEAKLTTQCKFEYHVLATFYAYATGLMDRGTQVIPPHPHLRRALPGMNKLDRFKNVVLSTYTTHEMAFRENVCLWRKAHQ